MAEKMMTPEGISGLPLLVAPSSPYIVLSLNDSGVANKHHSVHVDAKGKRAYFDTLAGDALRNIQLELLEVQLHNRGNQTYHDFYKGILLPTRFGGSEEVIDTDVFSRIVPAVAGHITRQVIDLNNLDANEGKPLIRDMTDAEYSFFTMPHHEGARPYKHIWYKPTPVHTFLRRFVEARPFGDAASGQLEVLLKTRDMEEKRAAGSMVMSRLVEIVPSKIAKRYPLKERVALLGETQTVVSEAA